MAGKRMRRRWLAAMAIAGTVAWANGAEISGEQAATAASAWLARTGNPMECGLAAGGVSGVETRTGADGAVLFHVVRLDGGGTVVLSGDTGVDTE